MQNKYIISIHFIFLYYTPYLILELGYRCILKIDYRGNDHNIDSEQKRCTVGALLCAVMAMHMWKIIKRTVLSYYEIEYLHQVRRQTWWMLLNYWLKRCNPPSIFSLFPIVVSVLIIYPGYRAALYVVLI